MTEQVRKAGKRGLRLEARGALHDQLNLTNFLKDGITPVSDWVPFDSIGKLDPHNLGMDYNDSLGCCGFAAADHGNVVVTQNAAKIGGLYTPPFSNLADAYWAYGRQQGEPGLQPDEGVVNSTFAPWLLKNGFIKGLASVPTEYASWAASLFGGAMCGIVLDSNADQDFESTPQVPWGSRGETVEPTEGHDVWFAKALPEDKVLPGNYKTAGEFITWGATQPFTKEFFETNVSDVWVFFYSDDPNSVIDWEKLEPVLKDLNGTF